MKLFTATSFKVIAIFISIVVTAFTLSQYATLIQHLISIKYNWQFELYMVLGMVFFQYPFIHKQTFALTLNYYFNMLLVSLIGSIILWPLFLIVHYFKLPDWASLAYFFGVVLIMFFEHKRRVANLLLPVYISYTWVLYRFLILLFILKK